MSVKPAKSPRKAVLVLGMHRSGTSALAGTLSILGCDLPESQLKADDNNSKGYFESSRFYALHTQLLQSAGSSWDDWLPINPGWFESARAEEYRDRIVAAMREEYGKSRLFVVKDPRICRLLPFWFDVLEYEECTPLIVHTHRHPLEVARSLERRDGIGIDLGILLWLRHVLDAEHGSRGRPRFFTSYHRLMNNWGEMAQGFNDTLGLPLPRMSRNAAIEVDEFLAPELKHFTDSPDKVLRSPMISDWVRDLYRILESWAEDGENEKDLPTLDRIRSEFDAAAPAFHRLVEIGQQTSELQSKLDASDATVNELQEEITKQHHAVGTLTRKLDQVETEKLGELTRKLDEIETERAAEREFSRQLETELEQAKSELATLNDELSRTKSHLEQRSHEADETSRDLADAKAEIAEKVGKIETLRAEIGRQEHELASHEEAARQHAADLANMSTFLSEREGNLEASREEIAQLKQNVKSLTDKLDEEQRAHAAAVARDAEQLRELEHNVESQVRELTQVTQILLDTEAKLERAQIKSSQENEEMRKRQAELEGKLNWLREKSKRAEDSVAAMKASTSWRITGPLRHLRRALTFRR